MSRLNALRSPMTTHCSLPARTPGDLRIRLVVLPALVAALLATAGCGFFSPLPEKCTVAERVQDFPAGAPSHPRAGPALLGFAPDPVHRGAARRRPGVRPRHGARASAARADGDDPPRLAGTPRGDARAVRGPDGLFAPHPERRPRLRRNLPRDAAGNPPVARRVRPRRQLLPGPPARTAARVQGDGPRPRALDAGGHHHDGAVRRRGRQLDHRVPAAADPREAVLPRGLREIPRRRRRLAALVWRDRARRRRSPARSAA